MPANTPPHVAVQYYLFAAEVILRPNYYNNLVTSGQITIATGTPVPPVAFDDSFNATMLSVARFFAEQGLTVTDIEDAAFYAANWIYSYAPSNSDIIFAANTLRASFTSNVRLPLGYNKDYWVPGVGIVPGPAQVINPHIHNHAVSNAASSSNTGAVTPPTTTATTTLFAHNDTPVVANNSASAASSAAVPATSIAPSTKAAPMSAEAVQQMDEIAATALWGDMPPQLYLPAGIDNHYHTLMGTTDNRPLAITDVQLTPMVVPMAPQVFNPPPVPLPQASSSASTLLMPTTITAGATTPAPSSSGPAPAGPHSSSGDMPPQMDESDG
ncbi:hypothetical protein BDP27DRAFT_1431417 [Rhodocollybia butyracea]|uniref:Uncharacterized protein n=1 Tax=Rhodocollybia butyracea TaxID=206335 RepID=A0A9P5TZF1_9AGAR|nr:hypothetical protein BDP27DRAFT_1431417 [Rhodocollybia butyracea]